ncbi:MAG: cell surface protein SprA [Bacteroidetes bacterium 4572_117]|nr:MAG: cell surface protein SprA [Bacteroidetes bacterium 4572_117]
MKNRKHYIFAGFFILTFIFIIFSSNIKAQSGPQLVDYEAINLPPAVNDTIVEDTTKLLYPFKDNSNPYAPKTQSSPLYLSNPSNIKTEVEYNPITGKYTISEKIGNFNYRPSTSMSLDEYRVLSRKKSIGYYWAEQRKAHGNLGMGESLLEKYLNPKLNVNIKGFDKIFGTNVIDIKPQGSAELIFGISISKIENPTLPIKLQRSTTFDFDMKIQMGVTGNIGDKMKVGINYNTEATFDFENQTTLSYTGNEDELIQSIEAGNVSLPLTGTLIRGSQSLFGLKTALQFGKLKVTSIFSQQKSESSVIEIEGGAQIEDFELNVDEYESNRHFFLAHYFKDNYDRALENLPVINSGVTITRVEVWVTNKSGNFDNSRNIIGFMDLAENQSNIYATSLVNQTGQGVFPHNDLNNLYDLMTNPYSGIRDINQITSVLEPLSLSYNFAPIIDYSKVENARLLAPSEYELNSKLGYISIDSPLNDDEVLAVAYEYTVAGTVYTVGEFSNSGISAPSALILKLLKGPALLPSIPSWDLMMKNVYSIGSYRINSEDFNFEIYYNNDKSGTSVNYIDKGNIAGIPLIRVMNLDQLNSQLDPQRDGVFDFMEKITINSSNGRVFFPVREPFGAHLRKRIDDNAIANEYVFEELYDSTQSKARQVTEKNKFVIKGSYRSSGGSEISLNKINIPEGSVKVSANGAELVEGTDYLVDYNMGKVTILNHGLLESGTPIQISMESSSFMNINRKTLFGTHLDYIISDNFTLGGTLLHLSEKPLTNKVNIGDEPISNTIWGVDGNYSTDFPFLTRLIDKLPFIETKEMSTIEVSGEFAQLLPGHSKTIGKEGNSYIDDFEGTKTTISLQAHYAWIIASTPKGQPDLFPEGNLVNNLQNGYNRAKLAWYNINTDLVRSNTATPPNITKKDQLSHFVREIPEKEIFPNKESYTGYPTILNVSNIAFYPSEKGPYNYDAAGVSGISAGINENGFLRNPQSRWGGIMRKLQTNDFEATNIEFIEFWLMDPFVETQANDDGGDLYFNLGYISEDILNDSRKSFENGLPTANGTSLVDTTVWGRVPLQQSLVNAFDNDPNARQYQDIGMDGLNSEDEKSFFEDYLQEISNLYGAGSDAYVNAYDDPSSDDYHFFRGSDFDTENVKILDRYKYYNGLEGNSPTSSQSSEDYPTSATLMPDVEDINQDNTLNEEETYFQYKVSLRPEDMEVGKNYITDMRVANVSRKDMADTTMNWYLFKIPVYKPQRKIGPISDFRSIRFMRLFMHDFSKEIVLRFASLDLVRSEWRGYTDNITEGTEGQTNPQLEDDSYDVSVVSIEENGSRTPVNYVLPPGISRVQDPTNPYLRQLNEQSISMKVHDLNDGDARAAYKNLNIDIRQYKRLQMEIHGEALIDELLQDNELSVFIRIGSDFKQNYYEYEIPLKLTDHIQNSYYDNNSEADRLLVWPKENRIDFELELLQLVKQVRNNEMRKVGSGVELIKPFVQHLDDKNEFVEFTSGKGRKVLVIGNPNLSNVKAVMIGVRNPAKQNNPNADDGMTKSGIVWMNELRVSDFRQEGGWASNARISTKLADIGSFTISGNTSRSGFGSIDKKINERQKEDVYAYDLSTNLELGKFFPKKARVRVPMYFGYSENVKSPQYNPLDPDILLQTTLSNPEMLKSEKDSIRQIVLDYTRRRSFNITNFKIEGNPERFKGKKKPFYHISNFSASFAFNEIFSRSVKIDHIITKNHAGSFSYVFNNRPKNYTPFRKVKLLKNNAFKLIRDFNFYIMPSMFSFRTDLVRKYQESLTRNITEPDALIYPTYKKDFSWTRNYDLKHSFSKAIKFQYTANNKSRIDEPFGSMDQNAQDYEQKKDTLWQNILAFGRNTNYNHAIMASYSLPLSKLPLLRWTSATARYKSTFNWTAAPLTNNDMQLGNTITNSNTIQLNGQFNFTKIYNKVPYLKSLSQKNRRGSKSTKKFKDVTFKKEKLRFKKGIAKTITHNLMTEDVKIEVKDKDGKEIKGNLSVINTKKVKFKADGDYKNASVVVTGKKEIKDNILRAIGDGLAYMLIGLKNISVSVENGGGTILPGYLPQTEYVGLTQLNNKFAPGLPFIVGIQDYDFAKDAARNNWLSHDSLQTSPFVMTNSTKINLKATLEPLKGLKIDVSAFRNSANNRNETMIPDLGNELIPRNLLYTGSFSMSFFSINTAFWKYGDNYSSKAYDNLKELRHDIAWRLARERDDARVSGAPDYDINAANVDPISGEPLTNGFPNGYSPVSQEVLIPSFLAAFSGRSASNTQLSPFPTFPMPNWRITYNGLSDITFLKRFVKTINLSHAYQSSYNVNAYTTNPTYSWTDKDNYGHSWARNEINELFIPEHEISNVTLTESFNPLISADMTWVNNLNTKVELRRGRTMTLSFANNQLIDLVKSEIIIGAGFRFEQLPIIIKTKNRQQKFQSDLNLRADFSYIRMLTIIRKLEENVDQITAGQDVTSIKFSADYELNERFNLTLFYNQDINAPKISTSFRTSNIKFGLSVRFTLIP